MSSWESWWWVEPGWVRDGDEPLAIKGVGHTPKTVSKLFSKVWDYPRAQAAWRGAAP